MKRKGTHRPTIEDAIEISGIEILHPGGYALTKRTAELCRLQNGMSVLDVSCGRGTQSIYYAETFGVHVTGLDISEEMVKTANERSKVSTAANLLGFILGDSQHLPFPDNTFDVVINECAVGIPDDSQQVLNEMLRVVKPNGKVAIHESIWRKPISDKEKDEISERYGTTPLGFDEWKSMLQKAGAWNIVCETEQWSRPEMFWNIRKNRNVKSHRSVMTIHEKATTAFRIFGLHGLKGVIKVFQNEKFFYKAVLDGKLGYALFAGEKKPS
jgi:ubiquinone/menaquinone biosynthesis C-methylase UbiE